MLEFKTHNFLLFSRKEIWFYNGEKVSAGTYNVYSAAEQVKGLQVRFPEKYKTTEIDLSKSEEDLFNAIHPTYKYDIRSAGKRPLLYQPVLNPTNADCMSLINSFHEMAKSKRITFLSKRWLSALRQSGNLYITKILVDGSDIVTHIYIFDKQRIILTNSFHNNNINDVRLRSEANKLLHWKDILLFKSRDFRFYDFGGVNPEKLPGISQFKLNFGGEVKERYRYIQASNLVYFLINVLKKIKRN